MSSRDLTTGSVPQHLVRLALPVMGAMLLQSTYALIDLAFVRQLGGAAVAGLSVSFQAFFIVLAISQAIATTTMAELSQSYGAGDIERARRFFTTFTLSAVALGSVSGLIAYLSADAYVDLFTDDPEVFALGVEYFEVTALTFLFQLLLLVFGSGLRASGDFVTPMKFMAISVLLNMALDPLLIFGWGPVPALGLAGAAWATVISQTVSTALYASLFIRVRPDRDLYWRPACWSWSVIGLVVTKGLPAGVQFFLLSVVMGAVLAAVKPFGSDWTATAGGGFRVVQQCFLPIVALASAAAATAGQNLGAKHFDRVRLTCRKAVTWATLFGVGATIALTVGGRIAGHLFAKTDAALDLAELYFYWSAPALLAFAWTYVPSFVLQAAGQSVRPMIAAIAKVVALYAFLFGVIPALELSPDWVFGATTASSFIEAIIGIALLVAFLRGLPRDSSTGSVTPTVEATAAS